jgi:anti-sigma factor RsiW
MTQTPSFRDVEKLSAYLDGQLKPSEKARLESRLRSEPELASVLKELRQTRGLLRQLPQRRAPRNFTLTPKMVGQKPPLPRTYPAFRFASVLATLLFFFTFATNFIAPRLVRTAAPLAAYGMGGGGGGAPETEFQSATAEAAQPALELPAAEEPAPLGTPTPLGSPAPSAQDSTSVEPTLQASEKSGVQEVPTSDTFGQRILAQEDEQPRTPAPLVSATVQILLGIVALLSGLVALILRYSAIRTWRERAR